MHIKTKKRGGEAASSTAIPGQKTSPRGKPKIWKKIAPGPAHGHASPRVKGTAARSKERLPNNSTAGAHLLT